jgi:hypothetical protein
MQTTMSRRPTAIAYRQAAHIVAQVTATNSKPDCERLPVHPMEEMAGLMTNNSFLLASQFGPYVLANVPIEGVNFPDDESRAEFERLVRCQVRLYALTCAAGDVAQETARRRPHGPAGHVSGGLASVSSIMDARHLNAHSGRQRLAMLLDKVSDSDNVEGFISWVYDKATRLVDANWDAIEALAALLEERRELDRGDLDAIVAEAAWLSGGQRVA